MATKEEIQAAASSPITEIPAGSTVPGATNLPPAGHGRRETLRIREDNLQRLIEERGEQIAAGIVDPNKLKVDPEIARYHADIIHVTNPLPNRFYCWTECGIRDNDPQHVHLKQMAGFFFVGPDDPECPSVPRSPEGHRRLGSAVLMWTSIENWVELKAREHARALQQRGDMNSADSMLEIASRHGVDVKIITNWNQLSPEARAIAEQRFTQRQRTLLQTRDRINRELREGTAHLNYGNRSHATL